jgi:NitT/TauT family transport system ATP-binding protein
MTRLDDTSPSALVDEPTAGTPTATSVADPTGSATDGAAIRLSELSKSFGKPAAGAAPVLDGIDLAVAPGEFVCLLGASGCGKSTLLNLMAGLEQPTTGSVEVASERPALMFQEPALFPWLSAGRNVELALRLRGVPRAERRRRATALLTLVRLSDAYDKRVHQLSGGMRQRVAMARALAQGSSVLLMDEPFAALDAITRDVLHDELIRLWQAGTPEGERLTIVFVTHNVREAVRLGQRVVLLSSRPGRVLREWRVDLPGERRIEDAPVAALAQEITKDLREEIRRHVDQH